MRKRMSLLRWRRYPVDRAPCPIVRACRGADPAHAQPEQNLAMSAPMLRTEALAKGFTLHLQGGVRLPVLAGIDLAVAAGRMRGAGRPVRGGKIDAAALSLRHLSRRWRAHPGAPSRRDGRSRRGRSAHRSWRCAPKRSATSASSCAWCRACRRATIVAEAAIARGVDARDGARARGRAAGAARRSRRGCTDCRRPRSRVASSSGSTSRVASSPAHPILLLDEPTASLDAANRDAVLALIARGASDAGTRDRRHLHARIAARDAIADRVYPRDP